MSENKIISIAELLKLQRFQLLLLGSIKIKKIEYEFEKKTRKKLSFLNLVIHFSMLFVLIACLYNQNYWPLFFFLLVSLFFIVIISRQGKYLVRVINDTHKKRN